MGTDTSRTSRMKILYGIILLAGVATSGLTKIKDGKGRVTALYDGELNENGVPNGQGSMWYKSYVGNWRGGLFHKKGVLTVPVGPELTGSYNGKFYRGLPVQGKLTDIHGDVTTEKFPTVGAIIARMFGECPDTSKALSLNQRRLTASGAAVDGVYRLKPEGFYIGKITRKTKRPKRKGTGFLVKRTGEWVNGKWTGSGYTTYPRGYYLKDESNEDSNEVNWAALYSPTEDCLFDGNIDSFHDINCKSNTTSSSTPPPPSTTITTTTTPTPCRDCITESGAKCSFPFKVGSVTYNSCTTDGMDRPWCPTRLDTDGHIIYSSNAFDYCSDECPTDTEPVEEGCPSQAIGFSPSCQAEHSKRDKNILFLGNSYTSPVCDIVAQLGRAAGYNVNYKCVAPGGQTIKYHSENSLGEIANGDWDAVMIQDQSQVPSFSEYFVYYQSIVPSRTLVDAIRAKNNCTIPVFYETWGKQNGDSQNCHNGNLYCSYEGIQTRLTESYHSMAYVNQPARVAPVGTAWTSWSNRNELFAGDGSHASASGSYLAACVMFQTIWGESPVGNSYRPVGNAEALQQQANDIVSLGGFSYPRSIPGPPCSTCI